MDLKKKQLDVTTKNLVKETLLAAWRNVNNYNSEASVKNWLFIVYNRFSKQNKLIHSFIKQHNFCLRTSLINMTFENYAKIFTVLNA